MRRLYLVLLCASLSACLNISKNANYFFIKGLNEYQKGNKTIALENYKTAYKMDKENIKILRELGFLYADLGNLEESKKFYNEALRIREYDENSIESLLEIAYIENDYVTAEKLSEKILDKNSVLYNNSQLKIALNKKEYNKAREYYQKIIEIENKK